MLVNTLRHDVKGVKASEFTLIYEGPGAAYRSRFLLFVPTGTVQYSTVLGGSNSNLTSPKKQSEARAQESKHIEEGPKPIFYYSTWILLLPNCTPSIQPVPLLFTLEGSGTCSVIVVAPSRIMYFAGPRRLLCIPCRVHAFGQLI